MQINYFLLKNEQSIYFLSKHSSTRAYISSYASRLSNRSNLAHCHTELLLSAKTAPKHCATDQSTPIDWTSNCMKIWLIERRREHSRTAFRGVCLFSDCWNLGLHSNPSLEFNAYLPSRRCLCSCLLYSSSLLIARRLLACMILIPRGSLSLLTSFLDRA